MSAERRDLVFILGDAFYVRDIFFPLVFAVTKWWVTDLNNSLNGIMAVLVIWKLSC